MNILWAAICGLIVYIVAKSGDIPAALGFVTYYVVLLGYKGKE